MNNDLQLTSASPAIIRNDEVPGSYSGNGPYSYNKYELSGTRLVTGDATVYYPNDSLAKPPFSSIVYCPPYTGTQTMLKAWGPFFASHGIVLVVFDTLTIYDTVESRATQQRRIIDKLKQENSRSSSPLYGKLDTNRVGAMGWSMGGGATWINSAEYPGLTTAMTLAGHNISSANRNSKGSNTNCPTLIMCGELDDTYLGGIGQSLGVYTKIPNGIPKILYEILSAGHFAWSTPTAASDHAAEIALAFQKTYLDGDIRWKQYIAKPRLNVSSWRTSDL